MFQILGILSATLSIVCYIPYLRDILANKTKPERASWFIWSVLGSIIFFSQLAKGATDSLWLTVGQTVGVSVIFILSIKYGMGGLARRDKMALAVAAVGLLLWSITKEAAIALILSIIVDAAGSVLTIIKSYEDPGTETMSTFLLSGTAGFFGVLSVGTWDVILLSFPVYIWLINYVIAGAIFLGARKKHQKSLSTHA